MPVRKSQIVSETSCADIWNRYEGENAGAMFAWMHSQPPAASLAATPATAPEPEQPRRLVNLTGKTMHLCHQSADDARLRVVKSIESSGPVPAIEWVVDEPSDTKIVRIDDGEVALPVFEAREVPGHFVVRNLRAETTTDLFLVDRNVFKVARKQGRRDLICGMPVSYKRVFEGVKGESYWCGICVHASGPDDIIDYNSDDSDDSDE